MLTFSSDALDWVQRKHQPVCIAAPCTVGGCCIEVTECPSVSLGTPKLPDQYVQQTIQGVEVYLPKQFPEHVELVIAVRSLLWFKWLALDGWKLA